MRPLQTGCSGRNSALPASLTKEVIGDVKDISPGAMTAIIAVAVVVILGVGYMVFLKPRTATVPEDTKQKYMQMMQKGGSSGGTGSGGMGSGGMGSGGMRSGG